MLLGSDSHTRYGPLGTLGIGGRPELVKQLAQDYDIDEPEIIAVFDGAAAGRRVAGCRACDNRRGFQAVCEKQDNDFWAGRFKPQWTASAL